jgi:hypothetical protein
MCCLGARGPDKARRRGAGERHSTSQIFFAISLRKHETWNMIFGYDTDLQGFRDRATNATIGARRAPR